MNTQFSNLSLLFIFVCLLIITINVLGGSMTFKDTVRFSFNKMIYPNKDNEEAFIDAEGFVAELGNISSSIQEAKNNMKNNNSANNKPTNNKPANNNQANNNLANNNEPVQENFSIQTRTFTSNNNANNDLMNEMTNFKPFNSNDGKNNIQSNLIDVCNQTQESIH